VSTAGLASASFPTNFTANQVLLTATIDEFETTTGLLSVDYPPKSQALVRFSVASDWCDSVPLVV
jgi:hypothetical protein